MRILTHLHLDLDAVASVWFALRFILKVKSGEEKDRQVSFIALKTAKDLKEFFVRDDDSGQIEIIFIPAAWDGSALKDGDLALDIEAGSGGIKGERDEDGTVHSCFMSLVQNYAGDQKVSSILKNLAQVIDHHDAYGSNGERVSPLDWAEDRKRFQLFSSSFLILQAFRSSFNGSDQKICQRMIEFFDGWFRLSFEETYESEDVLESIKKVGKVAILFQEKGKKFNRVRRTVFSSNFEAYIYVDGCDMGIIVKDPFRVRADDRRILKVIRKKKEEWFTHSKGYLISWGSRKSPAELPSQVNPFDLAEAFNQAWHEYEKKQKRLVN